MVRGGQYHAGRGDSISINMVYRYDTIPYTIRYCPPPPNKQKNSINHCTMPKHNKFLFQKRIMHVHILGFDVISSSCYHFTSLGKQPLWEHRCSEVSVSVVLIIVVSYRPYLMALVWSAPASCQALRLIRKCGNTGTPSRMYKTMRCRKTLPQRRIRAGSNTLYCAVMS